MFGKRTVTMPNKYDRRNETIFQLKSHYPYAAVEIKSHEDCLSAVDWIMENALQYYHDPKNVPRHHWFDFIWSNLRFIRKRMVQLEMDGLNAVGILERCARFHIFCAHYLCYLPSSHFVAKFNYEHLENCLVGLKYHYSDLRNRGITCTNETEFLSYFLIHFPDSYLELRKIPREIRESQHVRLALKFIETLNSNNFVAFFNLMKNVTFMQACLLHRYFFQMRIRALTVICKTYNRNPTTIFTASIDSMVELLAFEDDTELESYMTYFGADHNWEYVTLMQSCFPGSGEKPQLRRSVKLVDCKGETVDIKEIITGGVAIKLMEAHSARTKSQIFKNYIKRMFAKSLENSQDK